MKGKRNFFIIVFMNWHISLKYLGIALIIIFFSVVVYLFSTKYSVPQNSPFSATSESNRIVIYALEKDGSHIFDGAVIAAIDKSSGTIVAEQVADGNGRVNFNLPEGEYRFQPSPLKEFRVVGFIDLFVPLEENKPTTLLLTEIGPSGFGGPVDTCEEKSEAINLALETANYCETNSDCKFFQPDGFSCRVYINQSFDTSVVLRRISDYGQSCKFRAYKCPVDVLDRFPLCLQGKCSVDYR